MLFFIGGELFRFIKEFNWLFVVCCRYFWKMILGFFIFLGEGLFILSEGKVYEGL